MNATQPPENVFLGERRCDVVDACDATAAGHRGHATARDVECIVILSLG
jgi:hypothetical protein